MVQDPDGPDEPRFAETAREALTDAGSRSRLRQESARRRARRDAAVGELSDWEGLRDAGARRRDAVLYDLEARLLQLEAEVSAAGGRLHWARDPAEAADLVTRLEKDAGSAVRLPGPLLAELSLTAPPTGAGEVEAEMVVFGVDAVVAESATVVVLGAAAVRRVARAATVVAVAGIDQVLGDWADLEVWLQLRARSDGERMSPAVATLCGTAPGDGPRSFHLVLIDGGRSDALADPAGRTALWCIGCAACADVCPVYERVGPAGYPGHRAGPAGAVRTPLLEGTRGTAAASLPFASTLCGACGDVCPVRIDVPELLLRLRGRVVDERRANPLPGPELLAMQGLEWVLGDAARMETAQRAGSRWARLAGRTGRIRRLPGLLARWTDARDLPAPPRETFRAWWRRRRR
ncbi:MAG: lactate utilization protein [Streptosporangiales bacterium]|nr:lactate utilization protein [Streptosporangiales bacterium]